MKPLLATTLLFCSFATYGQSVPSAKPPLEKAFIEVTGTASKEITPDKIFVSIILKNQITDKQQYTIQKQEEELKKVLLKNNIDLGLLSLTDASSETIAYKKREVGYEVKKEFTLQLATAQQVTKIAQELQELNIKETSIVKVESSKIESLQKEVRIAALKAAKDKAEYLLQAIGEQADKPLEIREVSQGSYFNRPATNNSILSNTTSTTTEENEAETGFSKIKITFSYYVKYGIK